MTDELRALTREYKAGLLALLSEDAPPSPTPGSAFALTLRGEALKHKGRAGFARKWKSTTVPPKPLGANEPRTVRLQSVCNTVCRPDERCGAPVRSGKTEN